MKKWQIKYRAVSALLVVLLLLPGLVLAEGASTRLDSISAAEPGESVVIRGETALEEVLVRILRPNGTLLELDLLSKDELAAGQTVTLPAAAPEGTYQVSAGMGQDVAVVTFQVKAGGNGPEPSTSPSVSPSVSPSQSPSVSPSTSPSQSPSQPPSDSPDSGTPDGQGSTTAPSPTASPASTAKPAEQADIAVKGAMNAAGAVTASVSEQALKEALQKATGGQVAIQLDAVSGAKEYQLSLPSAMLEDLPAGQSLLVKTELASVTLTSAMLAGLETPPAGSIALVIGRADPASLPAEAAQAASGKPVLELAFRVDGKPASWSGSPVPAIITVPYQPAASEQARTDLIVVWHIGDNGNTSVIPSSRYNNGAVTFETTHFSQYAVVYSPVGFSDTASYPWAEKQIEALAARGIIEGTSRDTYTPAANIKRADYLHLLVKTLGLTAEFISSFDDISPNDYYYTSVSIAKKLGITDGAEGNSFHPAAEITRQDMFTLTYRALSLAGAVKAQGTAADLQGFADASSVASYAADSLATLYKAKLLEGDGSRLLPLAPATRAETAVLMYRMYQMK
jgi:hypothetical protein